MVVTFKKKKYQVNQCRKEGTSRARNTHTVGVLAAAVRKLHSDYLQQETCFKQQCHPPASVPLSFL